MTGHGAVSQSGTSKDIKMLTIKGEWGKTSVKISRNITVRSLRIFEEVVVGLLEEFQSWERRSSGKFTILLVILRKRRCWAFSFLNNKLQAWDPPIFSGLIFPTKQTFKPTVLLLKKAARCQPFLEVVRLRLKRSSLLNVYLNCKFKISLLTSHLLFSLFITT